MDGFRLLLMITLMQIYIVRAGGVNGPGYAGCFLGGSHWQNLLTDEATISNVDECVRHCSERTYAAISIKLCYCSDTLANIQHSNDNHCNVTCICNASQICGSRTYYSVYNTTMATKNISAIDCAKSPSNEATKNAMPTDPIGDFPTCDPTKENRTNCSTEIVEKCCQCNPVWLRIVVDVAVIVGTLIFIILIFFIVRCCRQRQRGMFDEWKPRAFRRRSQIESGSHLRADDPLHRNHSYRNLSGSSTLDRGLSLDSIEQVTGSLEDTAPEPSLRHDAGNKYGSLQTPGKGVSTPTDNRRDIALNQNKPTKALQFADTISVDEGQSCNRPATPDLKNKPRQNFQDSAKKPSNDDHNRKDVALDKPKRKSLINLLFKDSEAPNSQKPLKEEDCSPTDCESFLDKTWGSRYGKKDRKKSETIDQRKSISKDEAVFVNPKCTTLPNDIYAMPHKSSGRKKQVKSRSASDTAKETTSVKIENQDGYGRLSRIFKPRSSGRQKKEGDTTSPEEYSVLQHDLKGNDYDRLGRQEGTDRQCGEGSNGKRDSIPSDSDVYASVDDMEYAAVGNSAEYDTGYAPVGDAAPENSQNGDYEMVTQGRMK